MKLRRTLRYYSLKRLRIRQSWNKYNLFNMNRWRSSLSIDRTFFQQKWMAKSEARAYHGEHIKEKEWTRMFDRRLNAVVDMNPRYMAQYDGSEQATGRGSGLQLAPEVAAAAAADAAAEAEGGAGSQRRARLHNAKNTKMTPYMQMTFAPMERRLDIAIFRAMFASSARQARQFVVHGAVKVNGKPMNHPGYLLNPGDMFQVDPERVLFATGAKKPRQNVPAPQAKTSTKKQQRRREWLARKVASATAVPAGETPAQSAAEGAPEAAADDDAGATGEVDALEQELAKHNEIGRIKAMLIRAREILAEDDGGLGVKRKQQLRAFIKDARAAMSRAGRAKKPAALAEDADAAAADPDADGAVEEAAAAAAEAAAASPDPVDEMAAFLDTLKLGPSDATAAAKRARALATTRAAPTRDGGRSKSGERAESATQNDGPAASAGKGGRKTKEDAWSQSAGELTKEERARFAGLLAEYAANPHDPSKPYATPWRPRPFLAPFAFIPRYLEVNQNVCAAVYLRHPVARPGMSEVPTPFPPVISQLAHNWYLRRK